MDKYIAPVTSLVAFTFGWFAPSMGAAVFGGVVIAIIGALVRIAVTE